MGGPGRPRAGRDRDPPDHESDPHLRPPSRRRRARGRFLRDLRARLEAGAKATHRLDGARIVPLLAYADAAAAIDWLTEVFGFRESAERMTDENGVVGHAEMELDGAPSIMLATPSHRGPRRHAEECEQARKWLDNPWVVDGLFVEVDDVAAHHARAVAGGAKVLRDPEEHGVGIRMYTAEDLGGHRWMFGQPLAPPAACRGYPRSVTGAYLLELPGRTTYTEALRLQRSIAEEVRSGRSLTRCSSRARAGRDSRAPHGRGGGAPPPRRRGRRGGGDRPGREVDVPRARPARLLPDPRPEPARARPQAVRPRPRGGDHEDPRGVLDGGTYEGLPACGCRPGSAGPAR